jgi:hypothetical protein
VTGGAWTHLYLKAEMGDRCGATYGYAALYLLAAVATVSSPITPRRSISLARAAGTGRLK